MSQLYLKGVYFDTDSGGLWYLDNAGRYQEISVDLPYKVYAALIVQENNQTSGLLIIGNRYTVTNLMAGDDFSNVGFTFENIEFVATDTTPTDWSNGSTVVPAPVATVLQNTLGGTVVWKRNSLGDYTMNLSGVFLANKTFIPPFFSFDGIGTTYIPISDGNGTPSSELGYYSIYRANNNSVSVNIEDDTHNSAEWNSILSNSKLSIEIKVYQ